METIKTLKICILTQAIFLTHAKTSTYANLMEPRHLRQNFDPRHPPHFVDPRQNFMDPRHPHQSLTHAPTPPTLFSRLKEYRCLKNVVHQIVSKNKWLLLSASFTAKFRLVFVLTLENAFS